MMRGTPTASSGLTPSSVPTRIAGYAAIFDRVDRGGDIIRKGAFAQTLARLTRHDGQISLPLLWQHDALQPIGMIESLAEDDTGLRMIARIFDGRERGRKARDDVRAGTLTGLSFGYRVGESVQPHAGSPRELTALDLVEISLVTAPMQPLARVHAVEPILPP